MTSQCIFDDQMLKYPLSLLIPAFKEIGSDICVGMTGQWKEYPWLGAILLTSIVLPFLVQCSVERKYRYASLPLLAHLIGKFLM